MVTLLKKAGDGVDLDFEHLSHADDEGAERKAFGDLLAALRKGLDEAGL